MNHVPLISDFQSVSINFLMTFGSWIFHTIHSPDLVPSNGPFEFSALKIMCRKQVSENVSFRKPLNSM